MRCICSAERSHKQTREMRSRWNHHQVYTQRVGTRRSLGVLSVVRRQAGTGSCRDLSWAQFCSFTLFIRGWTGEYFCTPRAWHQAVKAVGLWRTGAQFNTVLRKQTAGPNSTWSSSWSKSRSTYFKDRERGDVLVGSTMAEKDLGVTADGSLNEQRVWWCGTSRSGTHYQKHRVQDTALKPSQKRCLPCKPPGKDMPQLP